MCLLRGTDWIFIRNSTFRPYGLFMCFVWIWEQTAIISLYSINWLVFITETECVYCAVRTGSLYIILRSAHTVYLCVLCGSENKQRLFPYTALTGWYYNRDGVRLLCGTDWMFIQNVILFSFQPLMVSWAQGLYLDCTYRCFPQGKMPLFIPKLNNRQRCGMLVCLSVGSQSPDAVRAVNNPTIEHTPVTASGLRG